MTKNKTEISEIFIHPIKPTDKGIVAFSSFVINNSFRISNVAIATSKSRNGLRLIYPYVSLKNGQKSQTFYPITKDVGLDIENAVLMAYNKYFINLNKGTDNA